MFQLMAFSYGTRLFFTSPMHFLAMVQPGQMSLSLLSVFSQLIKKGNRFGFLVLVLVLVWVVCFLFFFFSGGLVFSAVL